MEDANGKSLKPHPVFSMMSVPNNEDCNNSHNLLAGGGDRFVTVWRKSKRENSKVDVHNVVWEVEDQLRLVIKSDLESKSKSVIFALPDL